MVGAVRSLGTSNRIGFRAPQIIRFVIGGRGTYGVPKTIVWEPRAGVICVCLVLIHKTFIQQNTTCIILTPGVSPGTRATCSLC